MFSVLKILQKFYIDFLELTHYLYTLIFFLNLATIITLSNKCIPIELKLWFIINLILPVFIIIIICSNKTQKLIIRYRNYFCFSIILSIHDNIGITRIKYKK